MARAHTYTPTRASSALLAVAGACLATAALTGAALAPAADAATTSANAATGATGLSGPAGTTTSESSTAATVTDPTTTSVGNAGVPVTTTTTGESSGGAGLVGLSGDTAIPADPTVSDSADGFTLQSRASVLTAHKLTFTGEAPASDQGEQIELQRALAGGAGVALWVNSAQATIGVGGSFTVAWLAGQSGKFEVRAILAGSALATPVAEPTATTATTQTATSSDAAGAPVNTTTTATTEEATPAASAASGSAAPAVTVTVFKSDVATYYGAGLYGHHTACGEVLRKTTMGVANRTLKCGTQVNFYFNGNEITVPVIDRGPYSKGVNWDLTTAAAKAIGMLTIGRATVGTLANSALAVGSL